MRSFHLLRLFQLMFILILTSCSNVPLKYQKVSENEDTPIRIRTVSESHIEYSTNYRDIDYDGFEELTKKLNTYRKERLVYLEDFKKLMKRKDVILLDTRSKQAYDRIHLKGAVHLNFSDFTDEKLAEVIPTKDTKILIYCNNNFDSPIREFQKKNAPLALNIPTFINLYGYGYENIYELYTPERLKVRNGDFEYAGALIPRKNRRTSTSRK